MSTRFSPRPAGASESDSAALSLAFDAAYSELRRLVPRQLRFLPPGDTPVAIAPLED